MDNEILLVDKPGGMSSFGVVARVRRKLSENAGMMTVQRKDGVTVQKRKKVKVGHTGTLDPFATGLLILLIGKGTKRAGEFLKLDKEYIATAELGVISTTGDLEGERLELVASSALTDVLLSRRTLSTPPSVAPVALNKLTTSSLSRETSNNLPTSNLSHATLNKLTTFSPSLDDYAGSSLTDERFAAAMPEHLVTEIPNKEAVEKCVQNLVGENWQRVPNFSAVKINGQRAYKLAREGKQVEMPVRPVKIYEIEVLEYEWPVLKFRCKVSSGTYIRTLAEDIGKALGTGAYLTALRRTQVGDYRIEQARTLEELGIG